MVENFTAELMCNLIYKRNLDTLNQDPIRKDIINIFKEEFENVWFTAYDDLIVAVEMDSEAVFICQAGIFRYYNGLTNSYLSLSEYFKNEYASISIVIDIYSSDENPSPYNLIPLILMLDDGSISITDKDLSELYLTKLLDNLSVYLSLIKISQRCYDDVF